MLRAEPRTPHSALRTAFFRLNAAFDAFHDGVLFKKAIKITVDAMVSLIKSSAGVEYNLAKIWVNGSNLWCKLSILRCL